MKNCKIFHEAQTVNRLKEIIQPPLTQPDKILLRLWNKNFLKDIDRYLIQIFAFKVLQEYSSWVSRNGAVQMFFLTPTRNMLAGKFVK